MKNEYTGSTPPTDLAGFLGKILLVIMGFAMLCVVGLGYGLYYFLTH